MESQGKLLPSMDSNNPRIKYNKCCRQSKHSKSKLASTSTYLENGIATVSGHSHQQRALQASSRCISPQVMSSRQLLFACQYYLDSVAIELNAVSENVQDLPLFVHCSLSGGKT